MTASGWLQLALYIAALAAITKPMGLYLVQVLDANGRTWVDPVMKPLERLTYHLMGVDSGKEHDWKQYTLAMLLFSLVSCLFTYAILRLQHLLPLNPQGFGAVSPDLAFNTAVSFTTNTNWQSYTGEWLGGHRDRHRGGVGAGHRPALGHDARQLLGRSGADDLLSAAAYLPRVRRLPRIARHHPEFQALHQGQAVGADEDHRREEERERRIHQRA